VVRLQRWCKGVICAMMWAAACIVAVTCQLRLSRKCQVKQCQHCCNSCLQTAGRGFAGVWLMLLHRPQSSVLVEMLQLARGVQNHAAKHKHLYTRAAL